MCVRARIYNCCFQNRRRSVSHNADILVTKYHYDAQDALEGRGADSDGEADVVIVIIIIIIIIK